MKKVWLIFTLAVVLEGGARAEPPRLEGLGSQPGGMEQRERADLEGARRYAEIFRAAYADAGAQWHEEADAVYMVLGEEKFLVQAGDACPPALPDSPQDPPLCAVLGQSYPLGEEGRYPEAGVDPGRVRNLAFLKALYGSSKDEVSKHCVRVSFLGHEVFFNQRNGAAEALSRVAVRLEEAVRQNPAIKEYIFPMAGTFYWRVVRGTQRLSAHSFAIAIDLNTQKGLYWQWNPHPDAALLERTRRQFPQAIVDAFEAEGFIWGGKWSAFDFMHFEYRPEMAAWHALH